MMVENYKIKKLFLDGHVETVEESIPKETPVKIYQTRHLVYETTASPDKLTELEDGYKYVHYFNKVMDTERYPFLYKKDDVSTYLNAMQLTLEKEDSLRPFGLHCSTLCSEGGIVFLGCDIGRHNALYKAIGDAFDHNCHPSQYFVCSTSRVHYSFVEICSKANIKCIVTIGSVSDSAIALAEENGISLYGFAVNGSVNKYV